MKLGIIGAMDEEVLTLIKNLNDKEEIEISGFKYYTGILENTDVVIVKSGVGLVNMALCCQVMIDNWNIDYLINCGIAGGLDETLKSGDIVVSTEVSYFEIHQNSKESNWADIHNMETESFSASDKLNNKIAPIIKNYLSKNNKLVLGKICSSDFFIESTEAKKNIRNITKGLCIEMEGASMGHVCYLNKIPYTIIRIIADSSLDNSIDDYWNFKAKACEINTSVIIELCKYL